MSAHPPPVPPDQRPKNAPDTAGQSTGDPAKADHARADRNLAEQGESGNLRQNTTNKGLQQDR